MTVVVAVVASCWSGRSKLRSRETQFRVLAVGVVDVEILELKGLLEDGETVRCEFEVERLRTYSCTRTSTTVVVLVMMEFS